ncbi:MAG: aminopeptidase [Acidobacteriota bacterium]|nr:aminopeptidase [Acidobacteriota bacterium]
MKMRKPLMDTSRRSIVLALLLLTTWTCALAERRERTVDAWRPTHYDVSLRLNDQLTELTQAETKISIQVIKGPLKVIDLDFGQMTVDAVKIAGEPVRFEQASGRLNVQLPRAVNKNDAFVIAVSYHGRPADGLVLMADKAGKPSATGDNWPDRVHNWIPCLDHPSAKATVNFTITAPARDAVVANGQLTATHNSTDTTRTWTYTESRPISPYCMIIAVGEYAQSKPLVNTVPPLAYYVPQTDRDYAVRGFNSAPPTLQFFSETVAPFPYEKLALIVGATRFGGMENSSAIVFSGNLFTTPLDAPPLSHRFNVRRGLVNVTAHEIAHQWFGDSVSIKTWSDLWLSEGFATYFAALFVERYEGRDVFRDDMRRAAESYFKYEQGRRAPIYDTETEDLMKLLNANNYQKGAWVLHMLRGLMGDTAFFKGIRTFYLAYEHKTASTEDLRAALERASGMNLKEFFARWVYASGHPRYEASWSWRKLKGERGMLTIQLQQTQEDAPFLTPLPVEIITTQKTQRTTLRPSDRMTRLFVPLSSRPTDVRIDPEETILKELVVRQEP